MHVYLHIQRDVYGGLLEPNGCVSTCTSALAIGQGETT
jgi:hypothetical protein